MEEQGQLWNAGPVRPGSRRGRSRTRPSSSPRICREDGCTNEARKKQGAIYCEEHARKINGEYTTARRGLPLKICAEPGCGNYARRKQAAKYCEEHATSIDYVLTGTGEKRRSTTQRQTKQQTTCSCGNTFTQWGTQFPNEQTTTMREFCPECRRMSPLTEDRLRYHRVPSAFIRKWLAQRDLLKCDLCLRRLDRRTNAAQPTIDHDHRCCTGDRSCGNCVRGILCGRCNTWIGNLENMLEVHDLKDVFVYLGRLVDAGFLLDVRTPLPATSDAAQSNRNEPGRVINSAIRL